MKLRVNVHTVVDWITLKDYPSWYEFDKYQWYLDLGLIETLIFISGQIVETEVVNENRKIYNR